ncbi:MAG: ATP-dependent Clp protease proteolytic subunit [Lachnospiraceae bacterium]|nr:ATP-dependent Clp protease proteolytic subunit [Lachnospiraceae bacterium]
MNLFLMTPNIIKESSEGTTYCPIQDELFSKHRSVEVVGEITRESVYSLILQLRYLHHADPEKEITMYINSPGGSVTDGLALYDVMEGISCPIRTVCVGMAASMGSLLFAAGNERDILPHAKVMIHDPLTTGIKGNALSVEEASRRLMETREITASILAGHTGHSIEEVYEKTKTDSYFSAEEAVAWHLADRIIHEI